MKKLAAFLLVCCFTVGLMYADGDVTTPGDPVIGQPNNTRWPSGEAPSYAIDDNIDTKYLHFRDREESGEVGIIITPLAAGSTVVQGLAFVTGGDAPDRDPISFVLYGSNGTADVGPWTQIASGPVPDFIGGNWPRKTATETPMIFSNSTAYAHYKLMFPDIQGGIGSLFQISEIELLEEPENGWAAGVSVDPAMALLTLPETALNIDATITDFDSSAWTTVWTQVSGPAAVDFNGTENNEDVSVTFPAIKGNYVLQLNVTDDTGNSSVPRNVTVRIWDPAIDLQMVGHWPFDEENGSTEIHDLALDDDMGFLGNYDGTHSDPNFAPGWVTLPGATANNAADFYDAGYIEVYPEPNSIYDPNMLNLDAGVSVTSWVYAENWDGNRRVLQFGNNQVNNDADNIFRMLHEWGQLKFASAPGRDLTAAIFPSGQWHHMAGTYDGFTAKLYIDGVEVASETYDTYMPMRAYNGQVLTIGAKNKLVNYVDYPGDYMLGKLDDIRVYSYAIDVATVRSLVELGQNSAPGIEAIDVPEDVILTAETVDVAVDAVVYDAHNDPITYQWKQESPTTPQAAFSSTTVEDPIVTFSEPGTYVLRLTVSDGEYGQNGTIYRDVTVQISDANCEKVKLDGLLLSADVNEDCYVDIQDLAAMALDWLKCNNPQDENCTNPYL